MITAPAAWFYESLRRGGEPGTILIIKNKSIWRRIGC
jgi:hypothetical protein